MLKFKVDESMLKKRDSIKIKSYQNRIKKRAKTTGYYHVKAKRKTN